MNWSLDRPVFWCALATSGSPPRWPVLEDACQRCGMGETRPQDRAIPTIAEFNVWYSLPMAPPAGPPVGHKLRLTRGITGHSRSCAYSGADAPGRHADQPYQLAVH